MVRIFRKKLLKRFFANVSRILKQTKNIAKKIKVKKHDRQKIRYATDSIFSFEYIVLKRPESIKKASTKDKIFYNFYNYRLMVLLLIFAVSAIVSIKVTPVVAKKIIIQNVKLTKSDFKADEKIQLDVGLLDTSKVSVKVVRLRDGSTYNLPFTREGNTVSINLSSEMSPGKYKVILVEDNKEIVLKDFTWGVLAINFNKAVYLKDEDSSFSLGVLDEFGDMVCDASVEIKIKNTESGNEDKLSTDDGSIKINEQECNSHEYSEKPDYSAEYKFKELGIYEIKVKAVTQNGEHSIKESIEVKESVDFDVERQTATRLYPKNSYPVVIKIKANKDFKGRIKETLPAGFLVTELGRKDVKDFGQVKERPNNVMVYWDVNLKSGDEIKIGYLFDPPDKSPELYFLGKLKLTYKNKVIENALTDTNSELEKSNPDQEATQDEDSPIEPDKSNKHDLNIVKDKEFVVYEEPRYWQLANDMLGGADLTRLWTNGWELGIAGSAIEHTLNLNTAPVIVTTPIRSGTYAMQVNLPVAGNGGFGYSYSAAASGDGYYTRAYIYISTAPSADAVIMGFYDAGSAPQTQLRINTNRSLILYNGEDSQQIGESSPPLALNTWIRLELKENSTTFPQTMVAGMVDGQIFAAGSANYASGSIQVRYGIFAVSGNVTGRITFDDLGINSDATSNYENWLGEGQVVYARPNGNGTNTAWTGDYTAVDEITPNNATDFVNCTGTTQLEDYDIDNSADIGIPVGSQIKLASANLWIGASGTAGARTHRTAFLYSGASVSSGEISINSLVWMANAGAVPRVPNISVYSMPNAQGKEITTTLFDSLQVRLGSFADCNPQVRVSTIWVPVEYVAPDGGRVWSSGYETMSTQPGVEWTTTAGTINMSTLVFNSGTASLNIGSLGSGTSEWMEYVFTDTTQNGPYYFRTYLNVGTTPSAENRIMGVMGGAGAFRQYVTLDNNSNLRFYDEDGQVGSSSPALNLNQWYRLETQFAGASAGANDTMEAKLDGSTFATASNRDLSTGVDRLRLGGNLNNEVQTAGSWFFDDIAINQNVGTSENGYPGVGAIVHMLPIADGITAAWLTSPAGCNVAAAGIYNCIDERTPNDATDLAQSTTITQGYEARLQGGSSVLPNTPTVKFVTLNARMSVSTSQYSSASLYYKESTTNPIFLSKMIHTSNGTWFTNSSEPPQNSLITMYTRPGQIAAWDSSIMETPYMGIRVMVDGGAGNIRTSAMWALAEYIPTTITISGNIYKTIGATTAPDFCDGTTSNIALRAGVNTYTTNCAASTGAFSFSSVSPVSNGAGMIVWVDGTSIDGALVIRYDGAGDSTGQIFYQNAVTLNSDNSAPVTNSIIDTYDNANDNDIPYTVTTNSLSVNSGMILFVGDSENFTPGGPVVTDVTGGNLQIGTSGVATFTSSPVFIGGDINIGSSARVILNVSATVNGGDVTTLTNGTLTYSTSTPTWVINGGGTLGGGTTQIQAYNLILSSGGTSILDSPLLVNNNFILQGSTHVFDTETNDELLDIAGSFSTSSPSIFRASSTTALQIASNYFMGGTFEENTSTVILDGASSVNVTSGCTDVNTCTTTNFYNLTVNKTNTSVPVNLTTNGIRVSNTLNLTMGQLVQGTLNIRGEGATAINVGVSASLYNVSTGDLVIGGTVANAGTITLQANGSACGDTADISITSTSGGTQRAWVGAGTFNLNDVSVQDQGGTATIVAYNGTSVSGNGGNWSFPGCPIYTAPVSTTVDSTFIYMSNDNVNLGINHGDTSVSSFGGIEEIYTPVNSGTNFGNFSNEGFGVNCIQESNTPFAIYCPLGVDRNRNTNYGIDLYENSPTRAIVKYWGNFGTGSSQFNGIVSLTDYILYTDTLYKNNKIYLMAGATGFYGGLYDWHIVLDPTGGDIEYSLDGGTWTNIPVNNGGPNIQFYGRSMNLRNNNTSSTWWVGSINNYQTTTEATNGPDNYFGRIRSPLVIDYFTSHITEDFWQDKYYISNVSQDATLAAVKNSFKFQDNLSDNIGVGTSGWFDSDESTSAPSDFYNEQEDTYNLIGTGNTNFFAQWDIDGGSTAIYKPVFKLRGWISTTEPTLVRLEGSTLTAGSEYQADIENFSEGWVFDADGSGYKKMADGGDLLDTDEYFYYASRNLDFNDATYNFGDNSGGTDYIYMGSHDMFTGVNTNLSTNGVGSASVTWEYCSANTQFWTACDTWSSLTVTDTVSGAKDFKASGNFYFSKPSNWAQASVNGGRAIYYIRGSVSSGTYSTYPIEGTIMTNILLFEYGGRITTNDQTFEIAGPTFPVIAPTISVSGTAFTDEGITPLNGASVNKTVKLSVNGNNTACSGACSTEITTSSGSWSFSNVTASSGDRLAIYLDNETEEGGLILKTIGTSTSALHIYQNRMILRSDSGALTNSDLSTADDGDDDIKYNVSGGNVSFDQGFKVIVWSGTTYNPGGIFTSGTTGGDLLVDDNAVASFDVVGNFVGQDLVVDTGATFNLNAGVTVGGGDITGNGIITYSASTPVFNLRGNGLFGGNSNWKFYDLNFGNGTSVASTSANGSGNIIINNTINIGNSHNLNGGAKTWKLTASGTSFVPLGVFTPGTSTVSYESSSASNIAATSYYNLFLSPTAGSPAFTFQSINVGSTGWYSALWSQRKLISIGESMVTGSTQLSSFPLLVNLTSDSALQLNAQTDGDDILFTSDDGVTKLNHEIENYTSSNGSLQAFVRIPVLSNSVDTNIYMYYGNSTTSNQQTGTSVWDSNFIGVWHFAQTSGSQLDSTLNSLNGGASVSSQGSATGIIGGANDYNGLGQRVRVPYNSVMNAGTEFTVEAWIRPDTIEGSGVYNSILYHEANEPKYYLELTNSGQVDFGYDDAGPGGFFGPRSSDVVDTGKFSYLSGTWVASTDLFSLYYNGSLTISSSTEGDGTPQSTARAFQIGTNDFNEHFDGIIDEVRISKTARSADWLATTYNNISAPQFYLTVNAASSQNSGSTANINILNNFSTTGPGNVNANAESNDPIIDVDKNFSVKSGDTFQASTTSTLTIGQNFTNSGVFVAGSGNIIFDDAALTSILTYSTAINFFNLSVTTPGKAMQFDETDRTNVLGQARIEGSNCSTGRVFLDSSTNDNQWDFNVLGASKTFNYVDVEDSNAIAALTANNATADNDNNTSWTINAGSCSGNQTPTAPSNLIQIKDTTGAVIAVGGWINTTTIRISATASDPDASDTLSLCAEVDALGVSFSNTQDACGAGSAYSGTPLSLSVTIPNLNSGTEYHWQARVRDNAVAYSPWVSYGANLESARDFGVDSGNPSIGTVYDGTAPSVDAVFNSGSLSVIGANWTGFSDTISGISAYDYSAGTAPGETSIVNWTNVATGLSTNNTGLTLQTSTGYYYNVRVIDYAGNTSPVASSDGQWVLPTISFSVSPSSISFSNINASNSYSDTQPVTLTTSTNAYNGYTIRAFVTALLTGSNGTTTIQAFNGGTYSSPDGWLAGDRGFGYHSSDTSVQGSNIFNNNPCPGGNGSFCYAPFTTNRPGDIVADHTTTVSGTPISNESFTVTYRVQTDSTQPAMPYSTTVVYSITAIY